MNEIKHTPGPWTLETVPTSVGICHKIGPFPPSHDSKKQRHACLYADYPSDSNPADQELLANAHLISAAPDMLMALELVAAEDDAARHNGRPLLTSGVRLSIDAALIKAGRKAAPEPVRHVTIAGVRDE